MTRQTAHEALVEALDDDEGEVYTVVAEPDTRLSQLHAAYEDAKARADEASKQLKAITDAIKVELNTAAPEESRVELRGDAGPALRLVYSERWTLDSKRMRVEDPETYVRYARKGGSWTLSKVRA